MISSDDTPTPSENVFEDDEPLIPPLWIFREMQCTVRIPDTITHPR